MVIFNLITGKYRTEVKMINGGKMRIFIDTGSPISIVSVDGLSRLTGYDKDDILTFIKDFSGVKINGFVGGSINMIPIRVRNCSVDGIYFSDLFFLLNPYTAQKESLFGLDFITSFGSMTGNYSNPIVLDNPSIEFYKNNFVAFCGSDVIHEISALNKESSVSELLRRAEG